MTTFRAKRVRALRIAIASGVASALVLPLGVTLAWNQLLDSRASTAIVTSAVAIPDTPAALVAGLGEGGQLSHLFVATLDASGVGGTVVLLPIGAATEVEAPAADDATAESTVAVPKRLAEVYATDGLGGLANEVQGLLDVSFVAVGALGRVELINVLAPLGGVDVLLDRDVVTVAVDGTPTKLASAGESSYPIDRLVDIVLARRPNEKESERFARHREVWNGIVKRVGAGVDLPPEVDMTAAGLVDASNFMQRVLGGALQVWQLSAAPVLDKTANPKRQDMYALDRAEVVMVFASVAPSAMSGGDYPLTVMIDSAFNDPLVSRAAVAALLDAGIGVGVMREVSAQEQANTVIEADDEVANALQALLAGALGPMEKGAWKSPVAGIDAAITLGADFVASVRNK
ncbi:MAG: hypothetical protein FJW13_04560 [Actinobacteria bacterium]|nr:hypothetical protein [Actinomycetota bacterium]